MEGSWFYLLVVIGGVLALAFTIYQMTRKDQEQACHQGAGWREIGTYDSGNPGSRKYFDRFHLAALSTDGRYCLIAGTDGEFFFVWDVDDKRIIWTENDIDTDEDLDNFMDSMAKFLEASYAPIRGLRFRPVGLLHNNPLEINTTLGIRIELSESTLYVRDLRTKQLVQKLQFENGSGDWVYATFSDNGSTIVVVTPYTITFLRKQS